MLSTSLIRAWSVEWSFLKPNCLWKKGYYRSGNSKLGCTLFSPKF